MKTSTIILGQKFTVNSDLSLTCHGIDKTFSKKDMQIMSDECKGMNRIHKPMALLFWIDVKNGKKSNWNLI